MIHLLFVCYDGKNHQFIGAAEDLEGINRLGTKWAQRYTNIKEVFVNPVDEEVYIKFSNGDIYQSEVLYVTAVKFGEIYL